MGGASGFGGSPHFDEIGWGGCFGDEDDVVFAPLAHDVPKHARIKFVVVFDVAAVLDGVSGLSVGWVAVNEFVDGDMVAVVAQAKLNVLDEGASALNAVNHFFAKVFFFIAEVFLGVGSKKPATETHSEADEGFHGGGAWKLFGGEVLFFADGFWAFKCVCLNFGP